MYKKFIDNLSPLIEQNGVFQKRGDFMSDYENS